MPLAKFRVDAGFSRVDFGERCVPCEQARKGIVKGRRFERFGQVGGKVQILRADLAPAQRSQQNDWQRVFIAQAADLTREHDAIHLRHLQIKDGKFERFAVFDPFQSLAPDVPFREGSSPTFPSEASECGGWWHCHPRSGRVCHRRTDWMPLISRSDLAFRDLCGLGFDGENEG